MADTILNRLHPFHIHSHKGLVEFLAPTSEPVTLAEARLHLKIDDDITEDDTLIQLLISAARRHVEVFTRRALMTQTWDLFLDDFPGTSLSINPRSILSSDMIKTPKAPLQSVTTITYVDTDGATQTLVEGTDFTIDTNSEPGRIVPFFGLFWPTTRSVLNAVKVRFIAGYGDATDVPEDLKAAILVIVAGWYCHREDLTTENLKLSGIAKTLLWGKRIYTIK